MSADGLGAEMHPFPLSADLSADQLDGMACVRCGRRGGAMRPVRTADGHLVFAHGDPTGCETAR